MKAFGFANLRRALLSFLFPAHCPACGAYVEERGGWCAACLSCTVRLHRLALPGKNPAALDAAWAVGSYDGPLGELVRALKYRKKRAVLPQIGAALRTADLQTEIGEFDFAVPVPLHAAREKERGFNQAVLLYLSWLGEAGIPLAPVLVRGRKTRPQYGLGEEERLANVRGAFLLAAGVQPAQLSGKRILLLDDIMTTGATLTACAAVLKEAGAGRVAALVLASDR